MAKKKPYDLLAETAREINDLKAAQRASKKHRGQDDYSKYEKKFRARIGPNNFDSAFARFGRDILDRAIRAYGEGEKLRLEKEKARRAGLNDRLRAKGLSRDEILRYRVKPRVRRVAPSVQYIPVVRGKHKGRYEVISEKGKTVGYVTARVAHRLIGADNYRKNIRSLAGALGVTQKEAAFVYKTTKADARKALAAFKKTDKFKSLPKRARQGYTVKRWERGSLSALFNLAGIYGSPAFKTGKGARER